MMCSLVRVNDKEFIMSSWSCYVYYINADGTNQLLLDTTKEQFPTGLMYYNRKKNVLYMTTDQRDMLKAFKVNKNFFLYREIRIHFTSPHFKEIFKSIYEHGVCNFDILCQIILKAFPLLPE